MATARGRFEWGRTVAVVQWTVAAFAGHCVKPEEIAPPWVLGGPKPGPRALTPEQAEAEMEFTGKVMEAMWQAVYDGG